jgi:hypothetical protein
MATFAPPKCPTAAPAEQAGFAGAADTRPPDKDILIDKSSFLVGCSPELVRVRALSRRAEHRAPLIVDAVEQDWQQQTVIDIGEIPELCPRR